MKLSPAQTRALAWFINHSQGFIYETHLGHYHNAQLSNTEPHSWQSLHWNVFISLVARNLVEMYRTGRPFRTDTDGLLPWYASHWRLTGDGKAAITSATKDGEV